MDTILVDHFLLRIIFDFSMYTGVDVGTVRRPFFSTEESNGIMKVLQIRQEEAVQEHGNY
jgi:hypothetical protein